MPLGPRSRLLGVRVALVASTLVASTLGGAGVVHAASGIDVHLPIGRAITGTVTAAGDPVANVNLDACPPATPYGGPDCLGTQTDGAGEFRFGGLAPSTWVIRVAPPEFPDENGFLPDVAGGFYAASTVTANPAEAEEVSTEAGDPALAIGLPPGGHVAGIVDSAAGPVEGATVSACIVETFNCYPATTTASGAFDIPALEDGDYRVRVEVYTGADVQSGWAASGVVMGDEDAADAFAVVGGATTIADVTLPRGRHLSGTVNGPGGPLADAEMAACLVPEGYPCITSTTAPDGTYTITGLSQGTWFVRVVDSTGVLPTVFYRSDGATGNYREGTPVDLTDRDATGIDVYVPAGATLTGVVTMPGGVPAEAVGVQACIGSCNYSSYDAQTDASGTYTIGPLPAGSYIVNAAYYRDAFGGYHTASGLVEFEADAEALPIAEGASVTLDLALEEAGAIVGTVELSDGTPMVGDISACREELCQYGDLADGAFEILGVRPGTYVVHYEPYWRSGILSGYHATAGLVRTASMATEIVIDATEDEAIAVIVPIAPETIAGTVTAEGIGPVADARVVACAAVAVCGTADTAADGSFEIGALWPDEYRITVFGFGDFESGWYSTSGTVTDEALASFVTVGDPGGGSGNTEPGVDVTVDPVDPGTDTSPARVTFSTVTGAGETSLAISATGPSEPSGYAFSDPLRFFDLSTTAAHTGPVTVCLDYGQVHYQGEESFLRLLQRSAEVWTDITTTQDPSLDQICGVSTSLSTFAVVTDTYPFAGFFAPVANPPTLNTVRAGSTVQLKFSLGGNVGMSIYAEDSPMSYPIDCGTLARVGPRSSPDIRLTYDTQGSRYSIRWRTEKAWSGQCREFELVLRDGSSHAVLMDFRR